MLRIFTPVKIQRLRPGLNPQTWVPEASMLTTRPPKPSSVHKLLLVLKFAIVKRFGLVDNDRRLWVNRNCKIWGESQFGNRRFCRDFILLGCYTAYVRNWWLIVGDQMNNYHCTMPNVVGGLRLELHRVRSLRPRLGLCI